MLGSLLLFWMFNTKIMIELYEAYCSRYLVLIYLPSFSVSTMMLLDIWLQSYDLFWNNMCILLHNIQLNNVMLLNCKQFKNKLVQNQILKPDFGFLSEKRSKGITEIKGSKSSSVVMFGWSCLGFCNQIKWCHYGVKKNH